MAAENCDCPACRITRLIEIAEAHNGTETIARFLGRQLADVMSRMPAEKVQPLVTDLLVETALLRAVRDVLQPAGDGKPTVHSEPQGSA